MRALALEVVLAFHSLAVVLGAEMRLVAPCRTDDHIHLVHHTVPGRTFEAELHHRPRPVQHVAAVALVELVTVVRSAFSWATSVIPDSRPVRHPALVVNYCGSAISIYRNDRVDHDEAANVADRDLDLGNVYDRSGDVEDSDHSPVIRIDPDGA